MQMTPLQLIQAAGPVLWAILALSLYVVYVFFLHLQVLLRLGRDSRLLLTRVHAAIMHGDLVGALREVRREKSAVANVLRAGLERAEVGGTEAALNEAVQYEETRLFRPLGSLGTAAQIGPLLGLLGTVIGMIRSFLVFAQSPDPTPGQLSTGISEALVNTAAGLIVAIVAYLARNYLRSRAESVLLEADRVREALPAWLAEAQLRREGRLRGAPAPLYEPDRVEETLVRATPNPKEGT